MKLTDIGATRGSRAATAKLARQVQRSSVAAGKEARTNLEVLGISIGQEQSRGDTSTVTEAKHTVQEVLLELAQTLDYKGQLPAGKDLLTRQAYAQAAQIAALYDAAGSNEANELYTALGDFVAWHTRQLRNIGDIKAVFAEQARLVGPIADAVSSIEKIRNQAQATSTQWRSTVQILDFVDEFSGKFDDHDPLVRALCIAAAKQLGMSTT